MPSRAKILRGTFEKSRANPKEWKPPVGSPSMPEWLKDEAAEEWRRRVPMLMKAGVLAECDGATLAAYCCAWAELVLAQAELAKVEGRVMMTKTGYMQEIPQASMAFKLRKQVTELAREFGFTPSARTKVSAGSEEKAGDDFDDL